MALTVQGLVEALADGRFHTGEALGKRFGVSKAAIWKAMKKLAELGLEVHSVRGKGYRLSEPLTLLHRDDILAQLNSARRQQLHTLEILHSIDSTNSHALRQVQQAGLALGAGSVWACMSESQSAGRGRRGREWVSPFGQNLYLSVLREFTSGAAALDGLSLVAGLALASTLTEQGYAGIKLKWPNDLLLQGRKLAGILIEVSGDVSGACHVVIGMGLNLQGRRLAAHEIGQPWIALDQLGYRAADRNRLAGQVLNRLIAALELFAAAGFRPFLEAWQQYDITEGRELQLSAGGRQIQGVGRGVTPQGALLLETSEGQQEFHGGEVSLRLSRSTDPRAAGAGEQGSVAGN